MNNLFLKNKQLVKIIIDMKKHIYLVVIGVIIALFPINVSAAYLIDGIYYDLSGAEATVTYKEQGYYGWGSWYSNSSYTIPSVVTYSGLDYTVTAIKDGCFKSASGGGRTYYAQFSSIHLPSTLKTIGYQSFVDCINLTSIIIPQNVTSMGKNPTYRDSYANCFSGCNLLRTIIYTSKKAPDGWVATTETYVPDIHAYSFPKSTMNNYSIKEMITFADNVFDYTGAEPSTSWTCNIPGYTATLTMPHLESDAGSYLVYIPVTFTKGQESFSTEVAYRYIIKKATLVATAFDSQIEYGDAIPAFSISYEGFINGDNENSFSITPIASTTATQYSSIGEYPITISGGESKNYNFEYVSGKLNIIRAKLSITVDNATKIYGENNPSFSLLYFGLKNGEPEPQWDKKPIFNTNATQFSNVGTYPISVICEPHNYEITESKSGTLIISRAPLTLNAIPATREYYESNPPYTYTLDGLRNNDKLDCLSKQPTFECAATLSSDCGNYDIIPSSAEALNYDITYRPAVLTITPASLTVRASDITREYGEDNPVLKYELIGLKGADNIDNAIQEQPSLNTNATTSSNVGEYSIIINGGVSKNYTLSYRNGVLTITKAPLSVIAEDAERVYGDNNPSFVRSYFGFKLSDSENNAFSVLPKISCSATKMSNVGEYPITVTGGTSKNYEIMSYENGVLTITKATAILTPINKERYYYEENPSFDFTLSGLRNGDSKSCVTVLPQYICAANKLSNVGTYPINASDASAINYNFEYGQGSLTINPRQLTASVGNYSKVYGTENPSFDITYTGFVNNEDANALDQRSEATCSATKFSDVGSYPITISGGSATNYIVTKFNNGILTIDKADQTITWNQDLSNIDLYSQVELQATSDANLPVTYEMSPNNVATIYNNAGKWYLDCYGSGAANIRAIQNGDKNHNAAATLTKTLIVFGGGDDPSNPQVFLNVEEPGTLPSLIAENRKYQIKNLRLTGFLNGTDINYIREMCGSDRYGNVTVGVLETLDISGCNVVSGGRSYYQSNRTSDNVISDYMFYNCKVLTTLRIPDNTTSIGNYAFADCERLSTISLSNSVKSFGVQSFRNNISLQRLSLPNELEIIGDMAFSGCTGLTEITIPSSVTDIGSGITKDCQNLERIIVEAGNTKYASSDGVLYNSALNELMAFPISYSESEYIVPKSVVKIFPYAFENAKGLRSVSLPASLLSIGQDAFIGCINLTHLQVQALNPPTCQNDCFDNISKTRCELQVPIGCRSYYWVAPVWSEFNKIVETDFSGISNVNYDDVQVEIVNGKITISGCPGNLFVRIYHINGIIVYQEQAQDNIIQFEPSSSGIYLVVIGSKTYKIKL